MLKHNLHCSQARNTWGRKLTDGVLREVFGPMRDGGTKYWRKFHNGQSLNIYVSLNMITKN
jgi:hypothetical protein